MMSSGNGGRELDEKDELSLTSMAVSAIIVCRARFFDFSSSPSDRARFFGFCSSIFIVEFNGGDEKCFEHEYGTVISCASDDV